MSKRKKSKSRSRRRRRVRVRRIVRRARRAAAQIVKYVKKRGRRMARRSRRRRSSGFRRGGGGGLSSIRRGFISKEMLGLMGGAVGAGLLVTTTMLKKLPTTWTNTNTKLAAVHALVGLAGWAAVRKFSPTAAYGIMAVQIVRAVVAAKSENKKGLAGFGYIGTADGVDYGLSSDDDLLEGYLGAGDFDEYGMGEYDAVSYEDLV